MNKKIKTEVVVLGSGPGGYSTAFRCADLGLNTVLIEKYKNIGGVCLNVGCIPSKTLLHIAKIINEVKFLEKFEINFNQYNPNIKKILSWKNNIINKLTLSLKNMAKIRKIKIINGIAKFKKHNELLIENEEQTIINFKYAIIATGSHSVKLPNIPNDSRIWNSTDALNIKKIPNKFLIIGGGIIGLEIGTIYSALGSKIDIIESASQLIPTVDKDVITIFNETIEKQFNIFLESNIENIIPKESGLYVTYYNKKLSIKETKCYDAILISIGRAPNTSLLNINEIGLEIDEKNFIKVDKQMKTNISNIYAIGDITGFPMLAHKAIHQGHIAAEVIAGKNHYFDPKIIPSIAYTNPELAWVGITEKEAKNINLDYEIAIFPWKASGRAIATNSENGMTKLIFDKKYGRVIGGAVVGKNGGEILGEIALAIEMGCYAEDIALTIHAHPTLYESIGLCSEIFKGSITDLINKKSK